MVVKTEVCNFSELKMYPGHGIRLITKDGKLINLINKKSKSFYLRKTKGQVIRWTVVWRRVNKKMQTETGAKRRRKRNKNIVKGIQGMSKEEIQRRKEMTSQDVVAEREKFERELKDKKRQAAKGQKKTQKKKN